MVFNEEIKIISIIQKHFEVAEKIAKEEYETYTGRKWEARTICPYCGKKLESPVTNLEG